MRKKFDVSDLKNHHMEEMNALGLNTDNVESALRWIKHLEFTFYYSPEDGYKIIVEGKIIPSNGASIFIDPQEKIVKKVVFDSLVNSQYGEEI